MMPTLPVTTPVRPDAALPTPADPAAGPGEFARMLRDSEAPEPAAPSGTEVAAREPRHAATRERTGPGRTRTGDTPEAAGRSRPADAKAKTDTTTTADASRSSGADETTPCNAGDGTGTHATAVTTAATADTASDATAAAAATAADATAVLPDAVALALPGLPPPRDALDTRIRRDAEVDTDTPADATAPARRALGPVGGHALPGRHPLAAVDGRAGPSDAATPGDTRTRLDERSPQLAALGALAAAKAASSEPVPAATASGTTVELTHGLAAPLPLPLGLPAAADGLAAPAATDTARPVVEARLTAAPGSTAFTQALGDQIGVWVRDGVHEARLQLHPAELGPVQIQIALDGQAAQVDFHVAHARTREAIEASLPALASALRESGFTLAGGGVFGQGGGDAPPRTPPRALRGAADAPAGTEAVGALADDGLAATAARSRGWRRGLLDVFA
jgi:flagellar hook-length control protein FliK